MENRRKLERVKSSSVVLQMDYSLNNSGHFDLWKTETPSRPSSADLQTSQSFPPLTNFTSTLEFEPVPSLFSLSTCPPNYRDIQIFKEKGSHDIADALLSLKHPIVHPSQFSTGPISPLSPTPAMPYFTSSHQGFNSGMTSSCTQGLPYPHNPPVLHNTYSSVPSQYPPQYDTGQLSPTQPPTPNVHFPSMSVNVSMSMNVGVPPGLGNGQYNNLQQQWGNQPQSPTLSQYHSGHAPALQAQYTGYGTQTHPFQGSYSFTPELRTHVPESRGFYYKAEGLKDVARFCASGHFKKSKFLSERNSATSFNEACTMKTNFCRICGKTYARPSTLKTHLRTHSGEKPYKCHICSKSFSQAANLTAHTRTHSGEKPFRCPVCERRFSQSSSVTTHMRTHSGERPYRCRLCKKAFSDSSTLTKHLRIHSGEKPYQCKLCLLRFSQSGNLNRHMRVHANNN